MLPSSEPIDVTAILAQPREFVRRYENVLAQLEQAQRELAAAQAEARRLADLRREAAEQAQAEHDRWVDAIRRVDELAAELREWRSGRRTYLSPARLQAMIERPLADDTAKMLCTCPVRMYGIDAPVVIDRFCPIHGDTSLAEGSEP